jgi:hypothetical protein
MFAAMIIGYLVFLLLIIYIQLGLSSFSLQLARRYQGNLVDMFPRVQKLPAAILCMFAVFLVTMVAMAPGVAAQFGGQAMLIDDNRGGIGLVLAGYVLQIAGGLLIQIFFWPIPYLIADRSTRLIASIVDGPKLAVYNWKLSALLAIVNLGLSIAGALTCGIGLLFTYSLSFLLFAVAFDRLKHHVRVQ